MPHSYEYLDCLSISHERRLWHVAWGDRIAEFIVEIDVLGSKIIFLNAYLIAIDGSWHARPPAEYFNEVQRSGRSRRHTISVHLILPGSGEPRPDRGGRARGRRARHGVGPSHGGPGVGPDHGGGRPPSGRPRGRPPSVKPRGRPPKRKR